MSRRIVVWLAALVAVAPLLLTHPAARAVTPALRPDADHPIVVLGVDGLDWGQVTPELTALSDLANSGTTGLLAGRGADEKTTVLDAWATLSAGNRARAHDLPVPVGPAATPLDNISDPGVAVAQKQTTPARTGARIGALADALAPDCATSNGDAGAVLAAAASSGKITADDSTCSVRLLSVPSGVRAETFVRYWRPRASLLIVVGLGDVDTAGVDAGGRERQPLVSPAHLNVAIVSGPGFSGGQLTSGSTRRTPYVQLVDVAPTILTALGRPVPSSMIGQPMRVADSKPFDRAAYLRADERARFMPTAVLGVVLPLVVVFVLGLGLAALLSWRGRRDLAWSVARWDCRLVAATPVATFLARLAPYESWGSSGALRLAALWGLVLVIDAAVLLLCRGRVVLVAVATAVVLAVDVVLGAPLQLHSVLGYSALVAGRFAGLGNPAFGAFAAAVLLAAMLAAGALGGRAEPARPGRGVLAIVGVALVAVVVDGAPMFGSDVGGVLSLVPAFALLGWAAAGRRVRIRTLLLAGVAAVAVLVLFAALDLARAPDSRTHLGRFASDLLAGRAGETLSRKAAANWALLTRNVATLLVVPVTAAFVVVLARTERLPGLSPLARALREIPGLRAGLGATILAGALGFAVNDSGVVIPAVMMLLVVPAAVEVAERFREPVPASRATTTTACRLRESAEPTYHELPWTARLHRPARSPSPTEARRCPRPMFPGTCSSPGASPPVSGQGPHGIKPRHAAQGPRAAGDRCRSSTRT